MFYYLYLLEPYFSPLRVFRYITVRTVASAGTAFLLCALLTPYAIAWLRRLNVGQPVRREDAPPLFTMHGHKDGTPTMGGILIVAAVLFATLLWADPANVLMRLAMATMAYMAVVGFWDDYRKIRARHSAGMKARSKLRLEFLWAVFLVACLAADPETGVRLRALMVPFLKEPLVRDIGLIAALVYVCVVLIGSTNAVNLTDGLDGLAIGCSSSVALSYLVMTYVSGHREFADYLMIPYVRGAGELTVFCGALAGACLGFLWHNCHPAAVFMGDTGSLALGGALAVVAILIKQEIVLVIVGGVFVMEAVSVILQVASFKMRRKRIFAMAPIHHHFEMKGWSETQVTIRFWILSILFALLGLLTLKIR